MLSFLSKILPDPNEKILQELRTQVEKINAFEADFEGLSDDALKAKTQEFKERLSNGETLDDIMHEAFAVVREASKRVMNMRHYDVQMIGGIVLHRGQIAEMKTGEGKTLTSTLPIYLNALAGRGVHVITVNDYLSARDAVWMGQIYNFLGLSISCLQGSNVSYMYDETVVANEEEKDEERDEQGGFKVVREYLREVSRQEAYAADITYGTNNEFGFDYLRDNMAQEKASLVQRELFYTIIDEVDSVLIDEARTPLIISAPDVQAGELYKQFAGIVKQLTPHTDYNIDEKMRAATLTEEGIAKVEKLLGVDNLYTDAGVGLVHHLDQALKAEAVFTKDKEYVVRNGEIMIVDEFTGRIMDGRRYSEGLHQAIEAKEGVEIKQENKTMASITYQNLFRMYEKMAGMTGTGVTEAEEFSKTYGTEVVVIPTNKPIARDDASDQIFKTEAGKFEAIAREVKAAQEKGQPVLVGTASIDKSEALSAVFTKHKIQHDVLNAKKHESEGQIVAQAGRKGAVTIATNMAGRGVDIKLGGNPATAEQEAEVKELGGLYVIGSERHESRRIDNQLRGRSGRQGDVGRSQFFISMEDSLMRIFGSERMKSVMETLGVPDDMPIENKLISKSIESAQSKVEGHHYDARKHVLEYDDVLNKHRQAIYADRKQALTSDSVRDMVIAYIEEEIRTVITFHTSSDHLSKWDLKEIGEVMSTIFPFTPAEQKVLDDASANEEGKTLQDLQKGIVEHFVAQAKLWYERFEQLVTEAHGSDQVFHSVERSMLLRTIDALWVEHLSAMSHLRMSIGLQGYGQRDPLVEYKKEAYERFEQLQAMIRKQLVYSIYKIGISDKEGNTISLVKPQVQPSTEEKEG